MPIGGYYRLSLVLDHGSFRKLDADLPPQDVLSFPDYSEKLAAAQNKTGLREAAVTATGRIGGVACVAAVLDSRFFMGSILDYEPGQWAIGRKCVSRNEEFFCGHFPGQPVMPGVLILEALAQTGAVAALSLPENKGKLALFGGIKNARFRKQVTPGDVLTLHCELVEQHGPVGVGKASAWVDGKCAATAELTFVLTEAADNR